MKTTIVSPANIAFIKYWGRRNDQLTLPLNDSISMNMSGCLTTTTIQADVAEDEVRVKFEGKPYIEVDGEQKNRVINVVNRIRKRLNKKEKLKIWSQNSFPADAGIASSASAFSALTKATYEVFGEKLSEKELTIETRLSGSGSACRSIPNGFVLWHKGVGNKSESSFAESIYLKNHWDLVDLVLVVSEEKKKVGSKEGHAFALPEYLKVRQIGLKKRLQQIRQALESKDLEKLGEAIEIENWSLHTTALMGNPSLRYFNANSILMMDELLKLREEGVYGFFTLDAGPNVHVICEKKDSIELENHFKQTMGVVKVIYNTPADGAKISSNHLF